VRRVSIDDIRDAGSADSLEIPDSSPNPESRYSQREEVRILSKAVRNLRPGLRTTIVLRELRELSTRETARRMGLSVGTVKARIFRGKRQLRQELASYLKPTRNRGTGIASHIPQPRCNASGL
jgi:RNA polymerase sigma-70 factor (ECF subfamily)